MPIHFRHTPAVAAIITAIFIFYTSPSPGKPPSVTTQAEFNARLKTFERAASKGDADAKMSLAVFYLAGKQNGIGLEKNVARGIEILEKASADGSSEASASLYRLYETNLLTKKNKSKSAEYKTLAIQQSGNAKVDAPNDVLLTMASEAVRKDKPKIAKKWFQILADRENAEAQYFMSLCYYHGYCGDKKNRDLAAEYLQKSSDNGYFRAQYTMALRYFEGDSVEVNLTQGFDLVKKAAQQGYGLAQYATANSYRYGRGTSENMKQAVYWLEKAAEQAHEEAIIDLIDLYAYNSESPYPREQPKKAANLARKLVDLGNDAGPGYLGSMYMNGIGLERDVKKAIKWYQKAIEKGDGLSMYELAEAYELGTSGLSIDNKKALKLYRQALESGIANVLLDIARFRCKGLGGEPKDLIDCYGLTKAAATIELEGENYNDRLTELKSKLSQAELQTADKLARNYIKKLENSQY